MDTHTGAIDPHRPWIRDSRDDPAEMNWAATLFNPAGTTGKLHFSRAWTLMFLGRLALYLVPSMTAAILGISGLDLAGLNTPVDLILLTVPALLLPFVLFTLATEFTSFIAHVRRLADAGRPTWLAGIVLVPMMLGLAAYVAGAGMAAGGRQAATPPAAEAAAEPGAAGEAKPAEAKPEEPAQRRGPPGPPQSERQVAAAAGFGMALPVWGLASFAVMFWTLIFVARLPNGGEGRLRTGSDLTPEDIAAGA